ncbi:MAG: ATP-dependent helicase HrpB, partial [Bryobacter sp.]|nr:ATP-dependent helicase HrpB [Bryobacter sp.]
GGCRVLRSEGRLFPNRIEYTPASGAPLEEQVLAALKRVAEDEGDVLVFLPGAGEIRRALTACEGWCRARGWDALPLYGDLSHEEQDRAVSPGPRRKVILSTNVAESSITIEGVRIVIDAGLARIPRDSPWTGLPSLAIERVSQASATQRAGRAARTAPGRVIRLYPESDFVRRPAQETPEILRRELSQLVLDLEALGARDLPWLTAPPEAALAAARDLLALLGASGDRARAMARLPLHPRLARLVLEAGPEGCAAAALLSTGEARAIDLDHALAQGLSPAARRVESQLRRLAPKRAAMDLHPALVAAFPDRVAWRRRPGEIQLARGGAASIPESFHGEWLVALDVEERRERGLPLVRLATRIEPDWLLELRPESVTEVREEVWNRDSERVEEISALRYEGLTLTESRGRPAHSRLLAEKAWEAGMGRFADAEDLQRLLDRAAFAGVPLNQDTVRETLHALCDGLASFRELEALCRDGGFQAALLARLDSAQRAALDRDAPDRLRLSSGRTAKIEYPPGQPPYVAAKLQEFWGMTESPRVGATPLVVHLLAPNQRPVQVTTDLAGFWERHYPELKRQLSRRYPKHRWP